MIDLIRGDCMEVLPTLPADHFHCCVTSPPYFALRSYLPEGHEDKGKEIGSEPTPEAFLATMVDVFRQVRRVMHPSGLLFLNLGDSYAEAGKPQGRKISELQNLPHRVAEALRADGWLWRQTIIWSKPSPMPESVKGIRWEHCRVKISGFGKNENHQGSQAGYNTSPPHPDNGIVRESATYEPCPGCPKCTPNDGWVLRNGKGRCTNSYEYIFLLAKGPGYFWDSAACAEESECADSGRPSKARGEFDGKGCAEEPFRAITQTRNPRSVWKISSEPTRVKHFASYPSELVRRCLIAGTSAGGVCGACGAPYAPMISSERVATRPGSSNKWKHDDFDRSEHSPNLDRQRHIALTNCEGYKATCGCAIGIGGYSRPARVLDPFSGIATTMQTARQLGLDGTGIELNPEYHEIAQTRYLEPPRWWLRENQPKPAAKPLTGQKELF